MMQIKTSQQSHQSISASSRSLAHGNEKLKTDPHGEAGNLIHSTSLLVLIERPCRAGPS